MAVPRPVLLALLGLAFVVAAFLATRGGSSESVTPPSPAKPATGLNQATPKSKPATRSHSGAAQPKPAVAKPKPAVDAPPQVQEAAAALEHGEVVVFFFSKPGAADDTGARVAMRAVDGMKRVEVFKAGIDQLAAYRPMLQGVGISQVPATVIVRPGKRAVLFQGFVDAGTLRQNVADALR
jgi:hypothetical protein